MLIGRISNFNMGTIRQLQALFPLLRFRQNLYKTFFRPHLEYAIQATHHMPWRRGTGKVCSEVREKASQCPVWSSPQTTSYILPHTLANPWGPNSHVQDYWWSPGIRHGVHLRLSNPPRATRPRIQVPQIAMLYTPSPIRLHHSGCPILEQITGWDSQRILGVIFPGTPGYTLAVPVPRSTHLTHLLPQPIPLSHINPRKKLTPKWPFPYIPSTRPGRL